MLHKQHLDLGRTLQTVLTMTGEALNIPSGCLMTFADSKNVENIYILGAEDTVENRRREQWDALIKQGLIGYVYHSDRALVIRNLHTDPRWTLSLENSVLPKDGSAIGVPLRHDQDVYGVLVFVHNQVDYFDEERITLITEIAETASLAISNARQLVLSKLGDVRYQALFEHSLVPVILTDINGMIEDVNFKASELIGFSRKGLTGVPVQDINIASPNEHGIRDLEDEEETYFRTSLYDIDGIEIPTLVRARRVKVEGRSVIEWMLQDMSAQMELEQLKRDLSAMVYHDLRGPLSNISGSILKLGQVLQNHENPAVLKILQLSLRSTQQLQRLVDSLLDIQRLEEGKGILKRQPAEIHPMLLDAMQLVQPLAREAEQTIEVDMTRVPMTLVDIEMITRVIINLLENAVKYTPNGGKIILMASQKDKDILIIVKDSGPGIPEGMRQQIFDKFSRIKYENAPKGVGLGLNFCKLAVEAHGGKIWVDSDGVNGSEFKFTLPMEELPEPENKEKDKDDTLPERPQQLASA